MEPHPSVRSSRALPPKTMRTEAGGLRSRHDLRKKLQRQSRGNHGSPMCLIPSVPGRQREAVGRGSMRCSDHLQQNLQEPGGFLKVQVPVYG